MGSCVAEGKWWGTLCELESKDFRKCLFCVVKRFYSGWDKDRLIISHTIRKILKKVCRKAKIKKDVTVKSLRHFLPTHLLKSGIDFSYIQKLLGNKGSKTTEIYKQVSIKNPLDSITEEEK